jgi:hypothetical protein
MIQVCHMHVWKCHNETHYFAQLSANNKNHAVFRVCQAYLLRLFYKTVAEAKWQRRAWAREWATEPW